METGRDHLTSAVTYFQESGCGALTLAWGSSSVKLRTQQTKWSNPIGLLNFCHLFLAVYFVDF